MERAVLDAAAAEMDWAVDLRRRIHRRPEVGLRLPHTQEAVIGALQDLPLDLATGRTTSSVVATLQGSRPGPAVLLRGDMDALPMPEDTGLGYASEIDGAMHACGHDLHVAMLAAAARVLCARREQLAGRVVFMFQPGEEGHHGARFMLEEGLLDGADAPVAAFALHQSPVHRSGLVGTRAGSLLASGDTLRIRVDGRGGHASAPHNAVDPIAVACEIVTALQTWVTRRVDVFDPAVITIARIAAGTTSNVIPESAEMLGTIRTVSASTREAVLGGVRHLAEGIAGAHGANAAVSLERGYPVTVNDASVAATVLEVARLVAGDNLAVSLASPIMGSEDFSYVLERIPGAMAFLGTNPGGPGPVAPNHSNRMMVDESAMAVGIAMHVAMAERLLAQFGDKRG